MSVYVTVCTSDLLTVKATQLAVNSSVVFASEQGKELWLQTENRSHKYCEM